jgi:hypothetical protein
MTDSSVEVIPASYSSIKYFDRVDAGSHVTFSVRPSQATL